MARGEPILLFKNAQNDAVSPASEFVAQDALALGAHAFSDPRDGFMLCRDLHPHASELVKGILTDRDEETARPSMARHRHLNVMSGEAVEHRARDNLAAPLDPHAGKWRVDDCPDTLTNELGNVVICDNHVPASPL